MRLGRHFRATAQCDEFLSVAPPTTRWAVEQRLSDLLDSGQDVYRYFNNDWEGHAVADARWLRRALDDTGER